MEDELFSYIQRQLYYMIPEKWEKIALFASVDKNMSGELFFYYVPKSIIKEEAVNCYEVPALFDIQEDEYIDLLRQIYNNIKILKKIYKEKYCKDWSTITLLIKQNSKVILGYEDLENSPFSPYENHIIWRKIFLGIDPILREDKDILKKYNELKDEYKYEIEIFDIEKPIEDVKNMVNYERVLTADEVLARKAAEERKRLKKEKRLEKKKERKLKVKKKKTKIKGKYKNILPDE